MLFNIESSGSKVAPNSQRTVDHPKHSLLRDRPSASSLPPLISHSALLYTSITSMIAKSPPLAEAPCCEPAFKSSFAPPAKISAAAS